jgi:hypothetical protein
VLLLQAQHQANVAELQAACNNALSHVPLLNGASVGANPEQPDLQALQRQLQQGVQLLSELQPAMQLLLTGDPAASNSSRQAGAAQQQHHGHPPKGVNGTAQLTQELLQVAGEECDLLQQLSQQLAELSDLHLYTNSMQVQLLHLEAPPACC